MSEEEGNVINLAERYPGRFDGVGCLLDGGIIAEGEALVYEDIALCQECVRKILIPMLLGELRYFFAEKSSKNSEPFCLKDVSFDKLKVADVEKVVGRTIMQIRSRVEELQDSVSGRYVAETQRLTYLVLEEVFVEVLARYINQ